ncbi:MAG: J domain-containing protein [Spirochaetes bacterium]|nr:J domain-containing protein [Spirochaetota bacterium]
MYSTVELFSVLGLDESAGLGDLRAAYRSLVKRYHPDSSRDPSTAFRFNRVVKAYKTLEVRVRDLPLREASPAIKPKPEHLDLFALGAEAIGDDDPRRRVESTKKLGLSGRRAAYVFLRKVLYDADDAVVAQAVRSIALLGIRQAEGELASLYARASGTVREAILQAARGTREEAFRSALVYAERDPSSGENDREDAAECLRRMDLPIRVR